MKKSPNASIIRCTWASPTPAPRKPAPSAASSRWAICWRSGIGDTIRISYANDPIYEVQDGLELLYILGLRTRKGAELIACPTCGRIQVDLFTLIQNVNKALQKEIHLPIKVAVMGCVVNGPGECEGADVAIFAGDKRGIIYVQGEKVANVPEEQILDALLDECRQLPGQSRTRRSQTRRKSRRHPPARPPRRTRLRLRQNRSRKIRR